MSKVSIRNAVLLTAACMIMASCSTLPRVSANPTVRLAPRSADSIAIYEEGQVVPDGAREIGKVKVTDGGLTPSVNCMYPNMLALAVKKTAECGGNGLRIDQHKQPSVWTSTCHRIWGTMLLLPDSLQRGSTQSVLQELEASNDTEVQNAVNQRMAAYERLFNTPSNIVKVNLGMSLLVSKYQAVGSTYRTKAAFDYSIEYQHLWKWIGLGLNFERAQFSFDRGEKFGLSCLGPDVIFSIMSGKRLRWEFSCGVELALYHEEYRDWSWSDSYASLRASMSVEYRFAKNLAVGLQYDVTSIRAKAPDGVELKEGEHYGFDRLHLLTGLRYYF